jgi:hypothetical protein
VVRTKKGVKATSTHDGCGWRWWASPRYSPSMTIPLKSTGLGINVLALRIVFINPLRVLLLGRPLGLRVVRDSAAGRSVVSHIVWEFFFAV